MCHLLLKEDLQTGNTFSLIITSTEDNPRIFDERNDSKRPNDAANCSDDIFFWRTCRSWKYPTISERTNPNEYPVKT
jgi:hypothetical protein